MRQDEKRAKQQGQQQRRPRPQPPQVSPPQNESGPAPPPIPQINFDFADSNARSNASPSVPSIQINVDDAASSRSDNPPIPTFSFDSVPSINEPSVPPQIVFEVPGVSVSGPQFEDHHQQQPPRPPTGADSRSNPSRAGRKGGLICAGCEGPIVGRIVAAMNMRWHPQCFRCNVCQELLEHVSSYEHEGKPYCHLDYHEMFASKCYSCKTSIIEEQFISLDDPALGKRTYHMAHFFCSECGDPFLTPSMARSANGGELALSGDGDFEGFTVYKGYPYCEPCHVRLRLPKCKKCKKSIRDHDRAVEALGGKWCWSCFVCEGCHKPFEDPSFFQRGNMPYCEGCFSIILRNEL
ncbi:LIM domain-containing protein [Coprinopsis sp. MPI-PUGE-AT-0042]|nr:LIM domain-containing protein [Coprinopsis sp. MPI-PUGE-AT-0042]